MNDNNVAYDMFSKNKDLYEKDSAALNAVRSIWQNSGRLPNGEVVTVSDVLKKDLAHTMMMRDTFTTDHPLLTERLFVELAGEAIEPTAVLEPYLETLRLPRPGNQAVIPSWGGMHAADMAEGSEYPERALDLAGHVLATIGKVGLSVPLTEEMVKFSSFDVISKHVRAAGAAMKCHKEKKIADAISSHGTIYMDNASLDYKSTTGRNGVGAYNGTVTLEDFFYVHEQMVKAGSLPNTLIIHPNAWMIFAVESIARLFGLQRSSGWSADPSPLHRGTNLARQTIVPATFPTNWNIVVTPYLPYGGGGGAWPVTDIYMCDANAIGVIVDNGNGVETADYKDPSTDITKLKLAERYGVSILNDGKAIGQIKNVSVGRGIDFWENTVHTVSSLTGALTGVIPTGVVTGVW